MLPAKLLQDPAHLQQLMQLLTQSITAMVQGDAAEALALLDRAVVFNPAFVPAVMRRADLLMALERYEDAIAAYDDCLRYFPTLEEAAQSREHALLMAVEHAGLVLLEQPQDIALRCRQAQWQICLERFDAALANLDQALALAPHTPQILNLRGNVLVALNRHEDALSCYNRMLAQAPTDALALFNRANALQKMGFFHQAIWCYQQVLAWQPGLAEAEVELSHCLLLLGDYQAGWQHLQARWRTSQLQGGALQFGSAPLWLGASSLQGRSIVLWAEQGLGDTLQFARYVPLIAQLAQQVTVCLPLALEQLLMSLAGAHVRVVSNDKLLDAHDFHCPLMSLPLALRDTLQTIPAQVPYLHAEAELISQWTQRLSSQAATPPVAFKVGLTWAGRQFGSRNRTRDLALHDLQPLAAIDVDLISLQQQVPANDVDELAHWPRLRRFETALTDMAQTAALISNLDLVISADTAVIHLAGALGKPAWLLLRYESEWRWGWRSDSSHWYPGIRIFRQQRRGDWSGLMEQVAACLRVAIAEPRCERLRVRSG